MLDLGCATYAPNGLEAIARSIKVALVNRKKTQSAITISKMLL